MWLWVTWACTGSTNPATDGVPTADTGEAPTDTSTDTTWVDRDGDGAEQSDDCDDLDPDRHPGAVELCDGIDNDCDDVVDGAMITWSPPLGAPHNLENLATLGAVIDGGTVVVCPGDYDVGPGLTLGGVVQVRARDRAAKGVPTASLHGLRVLVGTPGADVRVQDLGLQGTKHTVVESTGAGWQLQRVSIRDSTVTSVVSVQSGVAFRLLDATVTASTAAESLLSIQADDVEFFGTRMEGNRSAPPLVAVDAARIAQADTFTLVGNDHGVEVRGGELRWFVFEAADQVQSTPALSFVNPIGGFIGDVVIHDHPGTALSLGWTGLSATTLQLDAVDLVGNLRGLDIDGGPGAATVTVSQSALRGNSAPTESGAGLRLTGKRAAAYLLATLVSDNVAATGGGIHVQEGVVALDGATLHRNSGSAVVVEAGATLIYADTDFGSAGDGNSPDDVVHSVLGSPGALGPTANGVCSDESC